MVITCDARPPPYSGVAQVGVGRSVFACGVRRRDARDPLSNGDHLSLCVSKIDVIADFRAQQPIGDWRDVTDLAQ